MIKILAFMKPDAEIEEYLNQRFDCEIFTGGWGDDFPFSNTIGDSWFGEKQIRLPLTKIDEDKRTYFTYSDPLEPDFVISYCSPWILPKKVLECAKVAAINFHPAPPNYPGIGGYNYAIHNKDVRYGVTCHHMEEKVDSGKIIKCEFFPITASETVESLKSKAHAYLKVLFYDVMDLIEFKLPESIHKWTREPYTRADFREFCEITAEDLQDGLETKLRACYYPGARDGPYLQVEDKKWRLEPIEG